MNTKSKEIEFLKHSNYIEQQYDSIALKDAKKAWLYAKKFQDKITIDYILFIHKLLMQNIRPDIAGKFRQCDVFIGGKRKKFINESLLRTELKDVLSNINVSRFDLGKEEQFTKNCHVMFENIHPFEDGNGRVGRILWQIHRMKLSLPIKIIHQGNEQYEYYNWFK